MSDNFGDDELKTLFDGDAIACGNALLIARVMQDDIDALQRAGASSKSVVAALAMITSKLSTMHPEYLEFFQRVEAFCVARYREAKPGAAA